MGNQFQPHFQIQFVGQEFPLLAKNDACELQQMNKIRAVIAPSILSADFANLQADCQKVLDCGADSLHIDIMDGFLSSQIRHFVNNLTIGPPVVASLRKKIPNAHFDCHLMVTNPENYLEPLSKAKINCFTFHYEAVQNIRDLCEKVRMQKIAVGISIKPGTEVQKKLLDLAHEGLVDKILIMTVEPGFGGQKFMSNMMNKVKLIRASLPNIDIQVDGGLNEQNTKIAAESGANCIVAGSSIFGSESIEKTIKAMKDSVLQNIH